MKKRFALISVSDKSGIIELASGLIKRNFLIISTGGTSKYLNSNGIETIEVKDFASFPEIFDGRVKTLQPEVFGGILMRRELDSDIADAEENNIKPIDVICVNLYPFPEVVKNPNSSLDEKIENIDIGGPSLIRAAAKNYKYVSVLTSPQQYSEFIEKLNNNSLTTDYNRKLAAEAFSLTSFYDTVIADFFEKDLLGEKKTLRINQPISQKLRYGENPHQSGSVFGAFHDYFEIIHGKELSYNNIIDLTAAVELSEELGEKACAIIKHTNPAGAAIRNDELESYSAALSGDPVSAFGGIVSVNGSVETELANKLNETFLEIVVAKNYSDEALTILKKKKNRRVLKLVKPINVSEVVRSVPGGFLVQDKDNSTADEIDFKVVTTTGTETDIDELKFAWIIGKHVKSNAIAITKDKKVLGVGAGQMSRVDSAKIAINKAIEHGHNLENAFASSDAFFPFPDGLQVLAEAGIKTIIEPGGSKRDNEVIEAAEESGVTLFFTGIRNFKH